ncbi:hypothetical protein DMH26_28570 [Streptomyces sp. WAC 05379]|uniref:hypothetical protein n=1 Tax=Streptomyces sp. WAC 05379 TaxID=2203207 RepID=UPI000F735CC5|nr:hypothetical protein [Streptomyces sp. WAC 05379]RSN90114.1 hypothetical protein DMH26_28570 [Streptomyces sp. WAC 05379]
MEWIALASTVVGGAIAAGSAGWLEHRRWRRVRGEQNIDTRRAQYGSYLAALATARHTCSLMARETESPLDQRRRAVWDAFEPCISLRYELAISAPPFVVSPTEDTFRRLRDIRDVVAQGMSAESNEYALGRTRYDQAHITLRTAMRRDLGAEP